MKKIVILTNVLLLSACAQLQQAVEQLPEETFGQLKSIYGSSEITDDRIAEGLRAALNQGIEKQVSKLAQTNGFLKNELVKIVLPEELQKVDSGLRSIGLSNLADKGLEVINRAAEDAVSESTPIFIDAVENMTFTDAKNILLGDDDAATQYLTGKTNERLYEKFSPIIKNSLGKVGADVVWGNIISRYNSIPFTQQVNSDLTDYVSQQALSGVFKMISVEESNIRNQISFRSTDVLKQVFALQDRLSTPAKTSQ